MAYESKTSTITTNGDQAQLLRDMQSHFANVQTKMEAKNMTTTSNEDLTSLISISAKTCNVLMLLYALYGLNEYGIPKMESNDFIMFLLITITPILNLVILFKKKNTPSYLGLYFKRKMLEEEQKIQELKRQ